MFHGPVLYHKLYIKNVFYLFQHVFVLDHASIVLFPNKILLLYNKIVFKFFDDDGLSKFIMKDKLQRF
jgi:hypothetical protein